MSTSNSRNCNQRAHSLSIPMLDDGGAVEEQVLYRCTPRGRCVPYGIIASTLMRRCCMHCLANENRIAMTGCQLPWWSAVKGSVVPFFRAVYTALRRYYVKAKPKFNGFKRQSMVSHRGVANKQGTLSPPSTCSVCPPDIMSF